MKSVSVLRNCKQTIGERAIFIAAPVVDIAGAPVNIKPVDPKSVIVIEGTKFEFIGGWILI